MNNDKQIGHLTLTSPPFLSTAGDLNKKTKSHGAVGSSQSLRDRFFSDFSKKGVEVSLIFLKYPQDSSIKHGSSNVN